MFFKNSVPAVQDIKKYAQNSGFIFVDFGPDPLARSGTLKSPQAPRRALGVFENPLRATGDLEQNPLKKHEFSIYLYSNT